ncbi:unnamed protein product [Heterobilharzia americana]|nr:unnamed protein product [Heterobilharzia americana]
MTSSEFGKPRNVFDALLTLVKSEKDDTLVSSTLAASHKTGTSSECNFSLLIKPEVDDLPTSHAQYCDPTDKNTRTLSFATFHDVNHNNSFFNQQKTTICKTTLSVNNQSSSLSPISTNTLHSPCISSVTGADSYSDFANSRNVMSSITICASTTQNNCPSDISVISASSGYSQNLHTVSTSSKNVVVVREDPYEMHNFLSVPLSFSTTENESYDEDSLLRKYVYQKCTQLRYPPQLALEMSKLYSPSKLPVTLANKPPTSSVRNKSSPHNRQLYDHGYMEIDSSHFTLNPSAILAKSSTMIGGSISRPRTKAQLRNLKTDKANDSVSEKTTSGFAQHYNNKTKQSKEIELLIPSDENEEFEPSAPCRDNPIVKRNKHRKRSRRFCISSRKTKQLSASTKSRSQYTNNSKYKLISKEDLISLKLVSSLDLDEDPEAKFSRTPHWIYTYASEYEKNVLKIIYCLGMSQGSHICYSEIVNTTDIHIRTSVGLSSLKSVRLAQHSTTISSSTLLFVVQWSSDSVLKGTLAIACSCLPPNGSWYNCCSKKFLQTISRLILKPEAKKHILELSKNFSAKPHQISSVSLLSPAVIMSQSGNDAHLTAHSLGDSVFQNANLYKDLLDCLPKSISTILRNNIGLSLEHIAAFGLLISSFHNTCVYVFSEAKTTTDCNSSSLSDERLSVNLFTGIQSLHHVVSSCLCRLRDSYASLMSAGACLKARYELSNANFHDLQQPPYMRIARGRARLFESESAARENIRRIFTEEVSPHILHLINVLENLNHSLRRISSNIFLLGPFFHRDTSFDDRHLSLLTSKQWVHESLEYTQNTIHSTIPLTELEFTIFIDTSFFLLEYLTSNVYKHIHMLSDNIQSFKHELSQTYSSIVDTWIPAYKELSTTVNSRADVDLTYFFSSLQSQYDVIEAWTRHQHETELRHIGSNMINLLTKLSDCWRCQSLYRNLNLPCRNLSVPYGSRNNSSQPMVKEMKIDSLLPWPPKHPSSVLTQHSVQRNIQEFQSKTACSANNDSEEFVYSRMTFSQDKSNKIPKSNMNMSHSVTVSNDGREVESFIRHQGSSYFFETTNSQYHIEPLDQSSSLDMNHAPTYTTPKKASPISDSSGTCLPLLPHEFDTTKSTTVMTSDSDSLLDKDSSISYTQPISDSHMNSQKSTCFSLYDDISTDSYSNCDITQKVTSVSSTDITDSRKLTKEKSIKKAASWKAKKKTEKINHSEFAKQLSAIVATTPETLDTPEITFVTDGKNKLHDTQHLSNLCPMPITNSSLSVEETSHASHNLTSNNEKQTIAGFGCLTSWFREKTLNPQAPGPVTAAILVFISSSHFSAAPCRDNPIVKRNKHRKRSRRFCISSRKTKQLSASTKSRSQYTNNSKYKLISKEDLISLKLVSSLDLDEDPEAKFSRTPHWIYTYASEYEKDFSKIILKQS